MRIAILTSDALPRLTDDDRLFADALERRGEEPVPAVWSDESVDWTSFDAIAVRSPWDYYKRPAEFARWLERVERAGTPVFNPLAMLRWNGDKRYLRELTGYGASLIPTAWVEPGEQASLASLAALVDREGWHDGLVVKPIVSGGAWDTIRVAAGEPLEEAQRHLEKLCAPGAAGGGAMIQPFVPEVVRDGEWSLLFLGGEFSHAVVKRAKAGDYRVQQSHGGSVRTVEAPATLVAGAGAILDAAAALTGLAREEILYARVDGVARGETFLLMELEALEPQLFLLQHPPAAERLADLLLERCTANRG